MSIRTPGMIKNYDVAARVEKYRIVRFSAEGIVQKSAAATHAHVGVSSELDTELNERCDVIRSGFAPVLYGGTVTVGALLTSDADGRAIVTTTANDRIVGIAEVAGVLGDIGSLFICPGIV